MKNLCDLYYEKLENLTEQPRNLIPLNRGKGVMSFDEIVVIIFGGVDFHDLTTNV
jgi:hypothetical protein